MKTLDEREAREALRTADGRTLESLRFPERLSWEARTYREVAFRDCTFDAPMIHGGLWSKPEFLDCRFESCSFSGPSVRKAQFKGCVFTGGDLAKKCIGSFETSHFEGCRFQGVDLGELYVSATTWTDCQLEDVRSRGSRWEKCGFTRVSIAGRLKNVNFLGCRFEGSDFTGVIFEDVSFLETKVFDVRLPDKPDNFMARPEAFAEASRSLEGKLAPESLATFREIASLLARSTSPEMVDDELFEELPSGDRRRAMEELYRLR